MRTNILQMALILMALSAAPSFAFAMKPTEAQIMVLEKKYIAATIAGDAKSLDSLLDASLVFVHGNGKVATKAETLAGATKPPRPGVPAFKIVDIAFPSGVKISVFNDAALLTGISDIHIAGTGPDGVAISRTNTEFCSYLWVRRDATWKLALLHTTPLQDLPNAPKSSANTGGLPISGAGSSSK
jgi:hypothetical protein